MLLQTFGPLHHLLPCRFQEIRVSIFILSAFALSNQFSNPDDDEEFEGPRKRRRAQPKGHKGPKQKIVIPKNRPNFYGAVPGVQVGRIWETRMACCADGIQRPTVAGIHAGPEGAYSISLSGGYEDDIDLGECFTYTGEGGRALKGTASDPKNLRTAPQSKDQTLTRGNLALSLNITEYHYTQTCPCHSRVQPQK